MKHRNTLFTTRLLALWFLAFSCLVFPERTQAVVPAPDGGYPGFNTAEGQNALFSLTTGDGNTAVGWFSLWSNAAGNFNTATGAGTLLFNTADENTAFGAAALLNNTSGAGNTATGAAALSNNTSGAGNTANGVFALQSNTDGLENTATGADALMRNTIGSADTATGAGALTGNTTGNFNTATGFSALSANMTGNGNTAIGRYALTITTGSGNTALGTNAGSALTTGDNNINIGIDVVGVAGDANTIRIGNSNITRTFIRGISGNIASGGATVYVESDGHLGTLTSSARFKDEIKPMDKASDTLFSLKPVTFRYKKAIDPQRIAQFGLVAEEVEKVNPDLVIRDAKGRPQTVRYEQINAMLLNEFLKEHRTVQELKNEIAALTATVKEQAAQIQKVSAKLEVNESRSRAVLNDPQNDRGW